MKTLPGEWFPALRFGWKICTFELKMEALFEAKRPKVAFFYKLWYNALYRLKADAEEGWKTAAGEAFLLIDEGRAYEV